MYRHLVAVEVSIKCRTYKRMQLNCLTLYQNRLKSLNTQSVQSRRTVQHNRMFSDDFFQNIPYLCIQSLYKFLGIFDILRNTSRYEFFHYKRFKQLDRHFLRQTALVNFQFRSYDDNGTTRIINTFSEQVLTETTGLTF